MKRKQLFVVTHRDRKRVKAAGVDCPFVDKVSAKQARRAANGVDEDGNENLNTGFRVACGPDHWRTLCRQ